MNFFKKFINFLKEAKVELGKVSWSTQRELMGSSTVVIVITIILAAFIGIVDLFLSRFLTTIMK